MCKTARRLASLLESSTMGQSVEHMRRLHARVTLSRRRALSIVPAVLCQACRREHTSNAPSIEFTRIPQADPAGSARNDIIEGRVTGGSRGQKIVLYAKTGKWWVQPLIDQPLTTDEIEVERVPVGRWVEAPIPIRQEGETTIITLLEEVAVVEKRLRATEEVRITRRRTTRQAAQHVTLRREEAVVERLDAAGSGDDDPD